MAKVDNVTGIILAGGKSQRFGSNKALVLLKGQPLISHTAQTLLKIFPRVFVVTKTPQEYEFLSSLGVQTLQDIGSHFHPINGLYSALIQSPTKINFIAACDMPFFKTKLIEALVEASSGYDALVCNWNGNPQPFCGVYSKNCLRAIRLALETKLETKKDSLKEILGNLRTRFFSEDEVSLYDPMGLSFIDIDTQEDARRFSHAF